MEKVNDTARPLYRPKVARKGVLRMAKEKIEKIHPMTQAIIVGLTIGLVVSLATWWKDMDKDFAIIQHEVTELKTQMGTVDKKLDDMMTLFVNKVLGEDE